MGKTNMASLVTCTRILSRLPCRPCTSVRTLSTSAARCIGEGPSAGKETHTGQVWDETDYRNVRFVGKDKLINPNWAVNLIAEDPVVVVNANHAWSHSCGALGHPKVYINLDRP